VRADDTLETLKEKVKQATILGTFQATLTDFKYVRSTWKKNCEEERLLGVSLTGIMDHTTMAGKDGDDKLAEWLDTLRNVAIDTNKLWAEKLGIPQSVAITTVKPSGTVSQLVDSASGIHPRYAHFYVRTVRQDKKDPLCQFLIAAGVPHEDDVTKPESTVVFSFPQAAPKDAVFRDDMTAIQQLNHYLAYKKHWCEHNPSITVYVRENEWLEVGNWVYKNFDDIGGVSFLPHSDHSYRQAPYQECTEAEYSVLKAKMPDIKWEEFVEVTDNVEGAQMLACTSGVCEIN
jgi:ribonucleoside-diphosphate reductase alpha chain